MPDKPDWDLNAKTLRWLGDIMELHGAQAGVLVLNIDGHNHIIEGGFTYEKMKNLLCSMIADNEEKEHGPGVESD